MCTSGTKRTAACLRAATAPPCSKVKSYCLKNKEYERCKYSGKLLFWVDVTAEREKIVREGAHQEISGVMAQMDDMPLAESAAASSSVEIVDVSEAWPKFTMRCSLAFASVDDCDVDAATATNDSERERND
jgi:hypothetical protein